MTETEKLEKLTKKLKEKISVDSIEALLKLLNPVFEFKSYFMLKLLNPVFEFKSYFKYQFTYENTEFNIQCIFGGDHNDIYRADLGKNMTFENLLGNGVFYYNGELIAGSADY